MATWKKVLLKGLDLAGSDVTNNHIGVTDGSNSTDVTIGSDITFAASGDLSVAESGGTITYSFTAGATTNSFSTINAPNGTDPVADGAADTLNLTNGNGITVTGNSTTDTIDIAVTDGGIDTTQLADDAVTTAKITDGNVTFAKMAGAAVITAAETIASNDDDTAFPTAAAVIDYVTAQITAEDLDVAGDSGTGAVDLNSQSLTIAGTANEIVTSASGQTVTIALPNDVTIGNNLTVTGDLTVSGTTTTVNTTNLNVEDHIILVATNGTPTPDTGTAAGLEVETSGTAGHGPRFEWTKDEGASNDGTYDGSGALAGLTGWKLSNHQVTNQAYFPIAVMEMVGNDATAPTGNSAGIGSFFFASSNIGTAAGELYLRVL